ncbi:hypothetical protein STENM327S_05843 [Streptomyces tendae]
MVVVLPHGLQELLAAEHLPGRGGQGEQQPQFGGAEGDGAPLVGDGQSGPVDDQVAVVFGARCPLVVRRAAHAAQHGAYACVQYAGADRFDHVVVGSGLQSHDDVGVVAACGGHDDRHLVVGAYAAAHLQAGHARQHQVEDHRVGPERPELLQSVLAGRGRGDLVPLPAQGQSHAVPDSAVVFDDQDPWHAAQYARARVADRAWVTAVTQRSKSRPRTITRPGHAL